MARDDAALWARIQSGDAEAFGLLFERYVQAIYAYCFRRTADADRAADLMSVTFLEAWRRRKVALHGDKVLPWLFGIATNVLRNERRARRRYQAALDRLPALPSTSETSTILTPPEPPPLNFERRRAHLLEEIARPGTRTSRPFRFSPLRRRLALAAALVLALAGVGTAFAVGGRLGDLDAFFEFFDKEANDPSIPRLIGDRAVITRGEDWAFVAWRSTRGLCTSLVFPENVGGTSCGKPVVGARETRGPEHLIVGGMYQGRPDDDLWFDGVAAANVSRVEVELTDGRRVQAPVYDAPAALGLDLKFFLVRTRPPEDGAPKVGTPQLPLRAFIAYDARGRLLEWFGPGTAP